jgi:hypothetical protein
MLPIDGLTKRCKRVGSNARVQECFAPGNQERAKGPPMSSHP